MSESPSRARIAAALAVGIVAISFAGVLIRGVGVTGVPFLAVLLGGPLVSNAILEHQRNGSATFGALFLNGFGVALFFNLVDLLIVDWLVLCRFTPRSLVIPGTEGMAGYKDYAHHFRGFVIGIGVSALLGVLTATVIYAGNR